ASLPPFFHNSSEPSRNRALSAPRWGKASLWVMLGLMATTLEIGSHRIPVQRREMGGDLRTVRVLLIARATIFALPFVEPDQVSSDTMKYVMPVVGVTPGTSYCYAPSFEATFAAVGSCCSL